MGTGVGGRACQYHFGLCAYPDIDLHRCPLCHASWDHILVSGWHSCEDTPSVWAGQVREGRVAMARRLRESAAESIVGWAA